VQWLRGRSRSGVWQTEKEVLDVDQRKAEGESWKEEADHGSL
jgi:hypothetical protein